MIEQAMIFALGFLIAGLLALAAAPAIWRRALRLSVRRLEMQLPLSPDEISAERDHVRAEAAVTQRRIEQKLSALNAARADDMGELGRRATALAAVEAARAALAAELDTTKRALNEANATIFATEKALHDTLAAHAATQAELGTLQEAHESLQLLADGRRASVAALEARSASLQLRLDDLHDSLTTVETRFATKSHEAARLAQDLGAARSEIAQMHAARETLEKRVAAETARRDTLLSSHTATQQEFEGVVAELRGVKTKLDRDGIALAALRAELETARRAGETAQARASEGETAAAATIAAMRAENAALNGALEAAQREVARLRDETAALAMLPLSGTPVAQEDALLRRSIREIGDAVVRLVSDRAAPSPPTTPADLPPGLAGLRISDLRPPPASAVAASAEPGPT